MVITALGLGGAELAVRGAGALGFELSTLVTHAGDEAPVVNIDGVHQVAGVDVFANSEVVDRGFGGVIEVIAIEATDQLADIARADAWAKAAETVVDVALLKLREVELFIAQALFIQVLVDPGLQVIVLVAPADLAAELELGCVTAEVIVAGQVQAQVLLGVLGVLFFPVDFVQAEIGGVVETATNERARLGRVVEAAVGKVTAVEGRTGNMPRAVFTGTAVTGLAAQGPQAEHAFTAHYVGLDLLGFLAVLELAFALGVAQFAGRLRVCKLEAGSVAGFGVLVATVEGAQVVAAEVIGLVIEVKATTRAFTADVVVALLEFVEPGAVAEVPGAAGFDVVRAEITLLPTEGRGHAKVVDTVAEAEPVTGGAGEFRAGLVRVLVVAGLGAAGVEQPLVIERRQALHIDGAAEGVGVHVRCERLDHGQRLHQLRRQNIEGHGAALALGGWHQGAVDGHAVEVRAQAAHADKAAFALVTFNADARQALHRLGNVLIRQLGDAVGMHHALDTVGRALLLEGAVDRSGLADHIDMLGGRFRGVEPLAGYRQSQGGKRKADEPGALVHETLPKNPLAPGKGPGNWEGTLGMGRDGSVTGLRATPAKAWFTGFSREQMS